MGVLEMISMAAGAFPETALDAESAGRCLEVLAGVDRECSAVGLRCSLTTIRKLELFLGAEERTKQRFRDLLEELIGRVQDELTGTLFMSISARDADLWEKPQLFGAAVSEKFPSATFDIEEAGKCLACGRGTATVFHLMRVMEVGLRAVADLLGMPFAPNWEGYLRHLQTETGKEWKAKSEEWRRSEPFYREVLGHLQIVKIAWRNPTMHVSSVHTQEQAEDIFNAVRSFIRQLAISLGNLEKLTPPEIAPPKD